MSLRKITANFESFFCGFIPRYVSNHIVSAVYSFMGYLQKIMPRNRAKGNASSAGICDVISSGYIEDQHSYTDMPYGKSTMQMSGCGIFAVYNALSFLGAHTESLPADISFLPASPFRPDLPQLIRDFEQNGMVLNGFGGTAPRSIHKFLTRKGIPSRCTCRAYEFNLLAAESRCIILTMFNDRNDIRRQLHTICITKDFSECSDPISVGHTAHNRAVSGYTAHNVAGNGSVVGPYPTFSELMEHINGGRSKIFFMIGIS